MRKTLAILLVVALVFAIAVGILLSQYVPQGNETSQKTMSTTTFFSTLTTATSEDGTVSGATTNSTQSGVLIAQTVTRTETATIASTLYSTVTVVYQNQTEVAYLRSLLSLNVVKTYLNDSRIDSTGSPWTYVIHTPANQSGAAYVTVIVKNSTRDMNTEVNVQWDAYGVRLDPIGGGGWANLGGGGTVVFPVLYSPSNSEVIVEVYAVGSDGSNLPVTAWVTIYVNY